MARIVVGVSGASGIILAYRTVEILSQLGHSVDLVMSRAACYTAALEMGPEWASVEKFLAHLSEESRSRVTSHSINDFGATIASGTYRTDGMVLIPCSMATLAAVAMGLSDNLLRRVADVMLKERRPLVIVPREAPLNEIHLENMLRVTRAGGIILPPVPAWYTHPKSLQEVEDFIVGRTLDLLKIENPLLKRWGDGGKK